MVIFIIVLKRTHQSIICYPYTIKYEDVIAPVTEALSNGGWGGAIASLGKDVNILVTWAMF